MKSTFIFKRCETIDGVTKIVSKAIPVNIPELNSGEGWTFVAHVDELEVIKPEEVKPESDCCKHVPEVKDVKTIKTFDSGVSGTAKLVYSKGVIKIVKRKSNKSSPNGVCIDDVVKKKFFDDCREQYGSDPYYWGFHALSGGTYFDKWYQFMKDEYSRQRKAYLINKEVY